MIEHPVTFPHGDDLLAADYAAGDSHAVLFLPGWGGTRYGPQRIFVEAALACANQGFSTLRLDFRGRGDSTGRASKATLDGMIEDAVAAVQWLRDSQGVDEVSLVGLCSGGNVAIGAASLLADVRLVICWSLLPFMEHKGQAIKQGTDRKALLGMFLRKVAQPESWARLLRGEANVRGAVNVLAKDKEGDSEEQRRKTSARNILADFESFTGKVRLLYGSRDPEAVGSRSFYTAWLRGHHIPVDTETILGAPHNFYTAKWTEEVIRQTIAWLTGK